MEIPYNMKGKICLVTGATSGVGEATAVGLARMGARVILVGRSPEKCARVVKRIEQETGSREADCLLADLSSISQVKALGEQVKAQYERLDVLINNAGGFFMRRELTEDGLEHTFALNHLSYFTLTLSLLDLLKSSAPARIINVASNSHHGQKLDFSNLQGEKKYVGFRAYGRSKLANLLFTYELARRLEGSGVTANVLHPGFVATNIFGAPMGIFKPLADWIIRRIALTPEQGAETGLYLAAAPEAANYNGEYFVRSQPARSSPASYDQEAARLLWEHSLKMTGLAR
jgi:NAD(P)-dependent dehydrogenase (short-subunit alcohol dehydrogenase family)